ncbi:MAG: DUF4037 domain-containing protein [Ruminococcus sp.]|uniref:DUF4037 domain-containing protein n=1 Tax=Schaedlerella arabinosiphila TaxID=2044587 RepID=A0A3R8KY76_9FIRM|nr:DUF4037 domain-containing protein [Schaedlerella arabinosiphila]MCI8722182.1 DUF4037 domain-containing protein [Ruminococcus sp.]RRK32325.1 DUF4037 domain-containing protein [Schaedlerella arabinosiphila]
MKGLELSRRYFETYGRPMLEREYGQYTGIIAAGLAGHGSECLGFDDEYSRDHDFGPGFCIWIPERYESVIGEKLQRSYELLPLYFEGYEVSDCAPGRRERIGVHSIESFYRTLIGREDAPKTEMEWFCIPERFLAMAVNGELFCDPLGEFSGIRRKLQEFYPEDVIRKKLAAKCAVMGQAGQYNYGRCIRRGMYETAGLSCSRFVMAALGAIYLLKRTYMPFYKWAFRGAEEFADWGSEVEELKKLMGLSDIHDYAAKMLLIERLCIRVKSAIVRGGWSYGEDCFMQIHAEHITEQIKEPRLRMLPIMAGE